jgi:cytosine/adenosine deaminase-related metal-dependent hydrolase
MRDSAEFAKRLGLQMHTHLAETLDEERYCLQHYGMRPVEFARQSGWLEANAWFAHAIWLDEAELRQMGDAQVGVAHCPSSNMRLGSGVALIKELLQAGVKVSLGVDGSASNDSGNFLLEARNAMLLSRLRRPEHWLTAREVLRMATRGGAAALGRNEIGSLEPGKCADLALFDVRGIEYAGAQSDPLAALVFCARNSPVDYLLVQGKVVIREGRTALDERAVAAEHNALAAEMLRLAERRTGIRFRNEE